MHSCPSCSDLYDALVTVYALTTRIETTNDADASDLETARRQALRALRSAGFGAEVQDA